MFYSHQLLARKAPLGQIWIAATMHGKIRRRKLVKLNIIKICEQILNPSVPMALRLSGILMGGVVIVYERKVKLLFDDVTRLLGELNQAWKVKSAPASDPTRLPKGKTQAKYASVTLPPNRNEDLRDIEESLAYSNTATQMDFQQTSYFAMRLDSVELDLNQNLLGDQEQDHHQAEAANITLNDNYDMFQADTDIFNHFERFDVEGDEEMQWNFTQPEHTGIPSIIPSPTREEEIPMLVWNDAADEVLERHHQEQGKQQSAESMKPNSGQKRQRIPRRKAKRPPALVMDYDQTIIPGHEYQSWLKDPSDLIRERKIMRTRDPFSMMRKSTLMELPSVVMMEKLYTNGQIHYPEPLMKMWTECIQPPHDSPSAGVSRHQPPEPSAASPSPERMPFTEPARDPFEGFPNGDGSPSTRVSIEKQRAYAPDNEIPNEILIDELRNNLKNNTFGCTEANGVNASNSNLMATPANSGDGMRSIPSSGSGHGFFSHNSETNSGRSSRKRPFSASKNSGNGLEPVAEDLAWEHADPNFKLSKLSKKKLTPDYDLLVETGTQTQKPPATNQPVDQITESIRMHLKTHFDTPGCAEVESLNQLALGMNKKRAASLFYQTCVLATRDLIKVEQKAPYEDILISRGPQM